MKTSAILETVCARMNVDIHEVRGAKRNRELAEARKVFCYTSRKLFRKTYKEIGKEINKDHATAMHAERTCGILMSAYKDFDRIVNQIIQDLSGGATVELVSFKIKEIKIQENQ
jgi:chromosomal replication initiation ATPase DnaA